MSKNTNATSLNHYFDGYMNVCMNNIPLVKAPKETQTERNNL